MNNESNVYVDETASKTHVLVHSLPPTRYESWKTQWSLTKL